MCFSKFRYVYAVEFNRKDCKKYSDDLKFSVKSNMLATLSLMPLDDVVKSFSKLVEYLLTICLIAVGYF